jgi:hypothetical protein
MLPAGEDAAEDRHPFIPVVEAKLVPTIPIHDAVRLADRSNGNKDEETPFFPALPDKAGPRGRPKGSKGTKPMWQ